MHKPLVTLLFALLFGLLPALTAQDPAAESEGPVVAIELQPRADLRGADLRLGDIAEVRTPVPELTRRVRALRLADRPARGFERTLTTADLQRALRGAGLPEQAFAIGGARRCVARPLSAALDGQRVQEIADSIIAGYLREHRDAGVDVEAELRRSVPPVEAPPGRDGVQLRGRLDPDRVTPTGVTVSVEVLVDGQRFRTVAVPYELHHYVTATLTARALERGAAFASDAVHEQRIPVAPTASTRYVTTDELRGKVAASRLAAGKPIRAVDLADPRVVERDDAVRVICQRGRVQVAMKGTALEPGAVGDRIQVRSHATGRPLEAVVASAGVCVIGIPVREGEPER